MVPWIARATDRRDIVPVEKFPDTTVFDTIIIDAATDAVYAVIGSDTGDDSPDKLGLVRLGGTIVDGEIFMEDPETGIIVMIDLSEMKMATRRVRPATMEAPYTWDEHVDTDGVVEGFFAENVGK